MGKEEASSRGEVRSCECEMRLCVARSAAHCNHCAPVRRKTTPKKNLSVDLSTGALARMRRHGSPLEPVRDDAGRCVAIHSHGGRWARLRRHGDTCATIRNQTCDAGPAPLSII